jgi:hypothetical protein
VLHYPTKGLKLLAVRNNENSVEVDVRSVASFLPFSIPTCTPLSDFGSFDAAREWDNKQSPVLVEGWVAQYIEAPGVFRRVKIKNVGYVELHHMADKLHEKGVFGLCMAGETDEWVTYLPQAKPMVDMVKANLNELAANIETSWEYLDGKDLPQKEFAAAIQAFPHKEYLFETRKHKNKGQSTISFVGWLRHMYTTKPDTSYETYLRLKKLVCLK